MTTLKTMRDRIYDETLRTDLSVDTINNAINDAIKLWEGERFAFNEKRYLILTTSSQEYYDLSGSDLLEPDESTTATGEEVLEIDSITNTVSDWPYPLLERTQQWFDEHQSSAQQYIGQPSNYTLYGNQLRLYPIPDGAGPETGGAYPIRISGLARLGPNPLSGDNDSNDWLDEAEILIREQAKILLYADPVGGDDEAAARAQQIVNAAYNNLKRKNSGMANTGRIKVWNL